MYHIMELWSKCIRCILAPTCLPISDKLGSSSEGAEVCTQRSQCCGFINFLKIEDAGAVYVQNTFKKMLLK